MEKNRTALLMTLLFLYFHKLQICIFLLRPIGVARTGITRLKS